MKFFSTLNIQKIKLILLSILLAIVIGLNFYMLNKITINSQEFRNLEIKIALKNIK
jgi:hypothetical protein